MRKIILRNVDHSIFENVSLCKAKTFKAENISNTVTREVTVVDSTTTRVVETGVKFDNVAGRTDANGNVTAIIPDDVAAIFNLTDSMRDSLAVISSVTTISGLSEISDSLNGVIFGLVEGTLTKEAAISQLGQELIKFQALEAQFNNGEITVSPEEVTQIRASLAILQSKIVELGISGSNAEEQLQSLVNILNDAANNVVPVNEFVEESIANFAALIGVDADLITAIVTTGSIIITYKISVTDPAQLDEIKTQVKAVIEDTEKLNEFQVKLSESIGIELELDENFEGLKVEVSNTASQDTLIDVTSDDTEIIKKISILLKQDVDSFKVSYQAFKTSNDSFYVNIDFDDAQKDDLIELRIESTFRPIFLKYRGERLVQLVDMSELTSFDPSRWATERDDSNNVNLTVFQGYARDLHVNDGCISEEFDAGVCEDPHVLTFGGNRLDLPHDENIYNMIDGLGLKINVKSQFLGDGSYAKYFYVDYNGENLIIDIEDLNIKQNGNRVQTKYHMLETVDYSGSNFVLEKQMRSLIVKSTDGIMELLFNSETRGLLIKSKLNFTQENSTGVLMSNYADECQLVTLVE